MPIFKLDLPADLTEYLQRRASRTGRTMQQTLETMIRESQTYDGLVAKMLEVPVAGAVEPSNN